ncbi:unnamed protein product [Rotaria sp. Silwood1]|nr:unnamed protein product [Rotaria sp. Silwood1]CAF3492948.1 unnamed protein product [Rotaria sp. Silwood1]CAF3560651.1 unnamed protein product [Rotaria sp. Silwood1]CAF4688772.1 unnamed protein product [Rotaria sp. Silwood1]CAF4902800.1 unnamed protein product [Rotaria sp. Silwood1]
MFNYISIEEKYQNLLKNLNTELPNPIGFRIAEFPLFLNDEFRDRLIDASNHIIDFILRPDFKQITEKSIPDKWHCANENDHPHFIQLDFGICRDQYGDTVPKLIELQGFPSTYALQADLGDAYCVTFDIPTNYTNYFNELDKTRFLSLFKQTIVGPHHPHEVILMDVNPYQQITAADFYLTQKYLNIPIISLDDLKQEGNKLFYEHQGEKKLIKRIYNRLVFDEINNDPDIFKHIVDIRQELDIEWITHPHWFYRISKFLLTYLKGDYIPITYFLNEIINTIPDDLENYVLKPLFSFGGRGVIIDITHDDIEKIKDPENWILQQKVKYEPVLQITDDVVIGEIRLMYLWPDGDKRPTLTTTLTRLSRNKLIGVRHNTNSEWTGVTVAFMENTKRNSAKLTSSHNILI